MGKDRQELLKVALLQIKSLWHQPEKNRILLSQEIAKIGVKADLVLLPEMFTTGFSMAPKKLAESMKGQTVKWMRSLAKEFNTVIAGSVIIKEEGFFFNRFLWVPPKDNIAYYDKRHGFSLVGEHLKYKAGENNGLVDYKGWKICLRICYDLRFPVWCRNTDEYDILLFVANWPKPRMQAWDTLLKARAIENMTYCCGVNTVGKDPKGNLYLGHSAGYDCFGNSLTGPLSEKKEVIWVLLDYQALQGHRKQFQFLEDRDNFELH